MAVTIYGVVAVSFMMVMYALESRSRHFIAAFALGCALVEQLRVPCRYLAVRRRRGRLDLRRAAALRVDRENRHPVDRHRTIESVMMTATTPMKTNAINPA